jgi:biopolymer transport protein TolR
LTDKLTAIAKERPDRQVFIRADEQVPYGEVIRTMAAIKAAGIENVGMVTQPSTEAASDSSANQHNGGKPDQ